jgi:hypothetical protein
LPGLVFVGAANLIAYAELTGGAPVTLGEAVRRGAGRFGSLFGVSIVTNLVAIVGLLLLIAPGVIVVVGWMAAPAAVMVENKTVSAALSRAWELSRGSRWRLVGLLLGVAALSLALMVVGGVLTFALGQPGDTPLVNFGVVPICMLIIAMFTAVGPAAAYTGLRIAKEGGAGDLSAVFA